MTYTLPFADVMEYVPDADMIFNYLMISALAAATDYIEREGLKPTGGKLCNVENYCAVMFSEKESSVAQCRFNIDLNTFNTHTVRGDFLINPGNRDDIGRLNIYKDNVSISHPPMPGSVSEYTISRNSIFSPKGNPLGLGALNLRP